MNTKDAVELAYIEFQKDFEEGEETNHWLANVIDGLKQAEKELKALEIIKDKEVNTRFLRQMLQNQGWFRYETYQDYLTKGRRAFLSVSLIPLIQEEFDLLKEVFEND